MNNVIPRPLLRRDPILVRRPTSTADSEGNVVGVATLVTSVDRGFWRELNAQEQLLGSRRGTSATSQILTEPGKDLRAGDWVQVFGIDWEVVQVDELRSYRRAQLRRVSG